MVKFKFYVSFRIKMITKKKLEPRCRLIFLFFYVFKIIFLNEILVFRSKRA